MKKLIFRKLHKDILSFFLTSLLVMSFIVWTIQAVNYFDFVTEDGHGLSVYFAYTIFNFPKILDRLVPFILLISIFYIIVQYELKNELNIFWIIGINKINFIKSLLLFSIFIMLLQIVLSNFFSPLFQLKARSYLKNSNVDFFTSLIKEGKFINISKYITIYIEKENNDKTFDNIFIEDLRNNSSKMIYAKKGFLISNGVNKKFKLLNGRVLNKNQTTINIFDFEEIDLVLNNLVTKTITVPKIQETNTLILLSCFIEYLKKRYSKLDCENTSKEIKREIYKRIYKPIFLPIITLLCCYLILLKKNNYRYKKLSFLVFLVSFLALVISETLTRYSGFSNDALITCLAVPIIIFIVSYYHINRISKHA